MRAKVVLLVLGLGVACEARAACPVFVLERDGSDVVLRTRMLAEGESVELSRDPRGGTVDVVLPVGPGRSANFVQLTDHDHLRVWFAHGELHARARRAAGDSIDLARRTLDELKQQNIRVSVTVADSVRRAWFIAGYDSASADEVGPAENMFAGRLPVPISRQGVVVQTDTWARASASPACGRAAFEREHWLFARGRRADGLEGWFVIDLGAAESVVSREFVPEGQSIQLLSTVEHSAAGTRQLPYAPAGATGTETGVVGGTTFETLTFGELKFAHAPATVLDRLPDVFGRPVVGILGLDLLRGCERLVFEFAPDGRSGSLALATMPASGKLVATTPFSWVASHLMVQGRLEGHAGRWILDSGSPGMVVDSTSAPTLQGGSAQSGGQSLRGLQADGVSAAQGVAASFALGELRLEHVPCRIAALPIFAALREPGVTLGVVGVAELSRVRALDVDFQRRVVRWLR